MRKLDVRRTGTDAWEVSLEGAEMEIEKTGKERWVIGPRHEEASDHGLRAMLGQLVRTGQTEAVEVIKVGQRFIAAIVRAFASLVLVLMVTAFLLIDIERVQGFARSLVPDAYRADYDELFLELDRGLSGVIRGQFVICMVNAMSL